MTPLFVSYVCDFCDGLRQPAQLYRGFVVLKGLPDRNGKQVYVFPTRTDAERYRAASDDACEIREIVSEYELRFHRAPGTIEGLSLGEKVLTVYPDHRFEPAPWRGYPVGSERSSQRD